jgi:outer membrane protein OmpA-like peptidoglycan-associated protein
MTHRKKAYIIGAGVTGLTAAQELAERGYDVTVYEKAAAYGPHRLEACAVGGMARTQYRAIPEDNAAAPQALPSRFDRDAPLREAIEPLYIDDEIYFGEKSDDLTEIEKAKLDELAKRIANYVRTSKTSVRIIVRGHVDQPSDEVFRDSAIGKLGSQRAEAVGGRLIEQLGDAASKVEIDIKSGGSAPRTMPNHTGRKECYRRFVMLDVDQNLLPGEHGYRFFPSFYRHLFDTMKRTQVFEYIEYQAGVGSEELLQGGRTTVYERLRPTTEQEVRLSDRSHFTIPRSSPKSVPEAMRLLHDVASKLEMTDADVMALQLRLLQYMSTGRERRRGYSYVSWSEYLKAHERSEQFRKYLENSSTLLLAMNASEGDARTHGSVTTQMLLDHVRPSERVDSLLCGPTSSEWFEPWRKYLHTHGVTFRRREIAKIEYSEGRGFTLIATSEDEPNTPVPKGAVVVLAVEREAAYKLTEGLADSTENEGLRDLRRLYSMPTDRRERIMCGVQFFFDEDLDSVFGHTAYLGSDWGLSAVYQPQFWWNRRNWTHGYHGILSVDVGRVDGFAPKVVDEWRREFAEQVWQQIQTFYPENKLPRPVCFNVDLGLTYDKNQQQLTTRYPMLVTLAGDWEARPGELPVADDKSGYVLAHGQLVLAGTYMKTFTRVTSMESACESARHAVNAILDAHGYRGSRCDTWDIEEVELEALAPLRALDDELFRRGLPHLFDITDAQASAEVLLAQLVNTLQEV